MVGNAPAPARRPELRDRTRALRMLWLSLLLGAAACGGDAEAITAPYLGTPAQPSGVATIEIEAVPETIRVGEADDLRAVAKDVFGHKVPIGWIEWTTSDTTVLAVESTEDRGKSARVRGRGKGRAKVTAEGGGEADTAEVVVEPSGDAPPTDSTSSTPSDTTSSSPADSTSSTPSDTTSTTPPDSTSSSTPDPTSSAPPGVLPAFPEAQGYGALSLSECRRLPLAVHAVTTTDSDGPGSFYDIIDDRISDATYDIVVFRTGGTIVLRRPAKIRHSCVYIAGQTAPGGGVQLRGPADPTHTVIPLGFLRHRDGHDVVIRYLRLRPGRGEPEKSDALAIVSGYNLVLDHVSTAFDNDKAIPISPTKLDLGGEATDHVTIQWSLITTSLTPHSTANPIGSDYDEPAITDISIHHNAYIHNSHRNPLIKRVKCIQVINNIVYNWRARAGRSYEDSCIDYIGNYYRPGPWSNRNGVLQHEIRSHTSDPAKYFVKDPILYMRGNLAEHWPEADQRDLIEYVNDRDGPLPRSAFVSGPSANPVVPVTSSSAWAAYEEVLARAGASARLTCDGDWTRNRDELDELLISQVRNRRGPSDSDESDHQSDYGGFPSLAAGSRCADADSDGMPDAYESRFGLDPHDDSDAAFDADGDGYLNVEEYLNGTGAA